MLIQANALQIPLAAGSVQCVVTSPPYWGLRDYGTAKYEGGDERCDHKPDRSVGIASSTLQGGKLTTNHQQEGWKGRDCLKCGAHRIDSQLGIERTPEEYVANMVSVFREVRRVMKNDGTLWLNLGDLYAGAGTFNGQPKSSLKGEARPGYYGGFNVGGRQTVMAPGLKPKDLVGIPWSVAFALQADGWYLRSDIIWSKPNPMPESVTDRPTKAHEYLFLMAKSERYFYDADAIKEPVGNNTHSRGNGTSPKHDRQLDDSLVKNCGAFQAYQPENRNRRTVWNIATQPWSGAHFATFPEKLVETCLLAGSRPGDIVFDPFVGSGTVIRVATRLQRRGVGCDLNFEYLRQQARKRSSKVQVEMQF